MRRVIAGLIALLLSALAAAGDIQSLRSIRAAAQDFVVSQYNDKSGKLEITATRLDPRLRLAQCDQPLNAAFSSSSLRGSNLTVNVQCNGSISWNLYIPVQVKMMQDVVVLTQSLPRNTLLTASDVHIEQRDINKMLSGHFSDVNAVIGKSLTRSVAGGLALSPRYIKSATLIKRGQEVTLLAETSGITVKMSGKALGNGAAGERIKVKNLSSDRVIEGVITENGLITTQM